MERTVNKARSFDQARLWDIEQHLSMTSEERQAAARALRLRVFGPNPPDVRESERARGR